MERVIGPVIADLQCEHSAAGDRVWRRRRIRLAGYVAFWKTVCLHVGSESPRIAREWLSAESWALGRTLVYSGVAVVTVTALLLPIVSIFSEASVIYLYLIPSALAVGLPFGFMGGVLLASRGRPATRHVTRGIVAIAVVLTAIQFASFNWITPSANHAFRVRAQEAAGGQPPPKGYNEMTLRELSLEVTAQRMHGSPGGSVAMQYDIRWVLCAMPMILGLFAVALASARRGIVSSIAIVFATQALFTIYINQARHMVTPGGMLALASGPLILAMAWTPNVICAVWTAVLLKRAGHHA
jgi:hypothetical protein